MSKPLVIDLCCGLGGWSEGFLAEGYDCIGFDIERHDYGTGGYPGQLVLQDIRTLHGSQFKDAAVIVASPPCQKYSFMAMPFSRGKKIRQEYLEGIRSVDELNELFNACLRIGRESGRPIIIENVRGAQEWVGPAKWNHGSYYLWGDLPALMPIAISVKVAGLGAGFRPPGHPDHKPGLSFNTASERVIRQISPSWRAKHYEYTPKMLQNEGIKVHGNNLADVGFNVSVARTIDPSTKPEGFKLSEEDRRQHLHFTRKAASAHIAKIPFPLSHWIAKCFKP